MNYFKTVIIALFAVSEVYGGASLECPSICPAVFQPTCATNGKEFFNFNNLCSLKVFNCDRQRLDLSKYEKTDIDWCTTTNLDEVETDLVPDLDKANQSCNIRPCPMIYRPVCGSNGIYRKTFSNVCVMNSFGCLFKNQNEKNWRVLQKGKCSQYAQDE